MNPAFECPSGTPAKDMAKYIEMDDVPSFITDERFRILAYNKLAAKELKVYEGELVLRLIFPSDYLMFVKMNIGQISRAKFNNKNKSVITVSRFKEYFLFRQEKTTKAFVQSAIRMKVEAEQRVAAVEEIFARMGNEVLANDRSIVEVRNKQLLRRMNAHQMLEMVSDVTLRSRESFEPGMHAAKVCKLANDILYDLGVFVNCDAIPSHYCCNGVVTDYQTAIAAIVAFAAENCARGKIKLKTMFSDRKYILCVQFDVASKSHLGTERANEQLEFIRCIAESNGWFAKFAEQDCKYNVILILPCNEERSLYLRAPRDDNYLHFLVKLQFCDVQVPKQRKQNN